MGSTKHRHAFATSSSRTFATSSSSRIDKAEPVEELITSTTNPFVKHCVRLREKARYRREQGRLLLVGSTIVRELAGTAADSIQHAHCHNRH